MAPHKIQQIESLIDEEKALIEKIITLSSEEHLLKGDFQVLLDEYFEEEKKQMGNQK